MVNTSISVCVCVCLHSLTATVNLRCVLSSLGSGTGVDWTEYVDEGGNPYCEEETQSASSGCV